MGYWLIDIIMENEQIERIVDVIADSFNQPNAKNRSSEPVNMVDGLFAIARGLESVAHAIESLGLNGADTRMGAIELLAKEIKGLGEVMRNA